MEELKEETEKVKTSVTKIITDASDIIMDRLKNPYITAFAISWIAFNWKPIALFIFSKGTAEYKINLISKHYSNEWNYLYFPIIFAIIFLFIVPYLNQFNEWFVSFSVEKRADYIKKQVLKKIVRDTEIAKELDKKEKAIKYAREGEQHNEFVDSLNKTISDLKETLHQERLKNTESINFRNEEFKNQIEIYEKKITDLKDQLQTNTRNSTNDYQQLSDQLNKELAEKNQDLEVLKFKYNTQKVNNSRLLHYGEGLILEYHNPNNAIIYYDTINKLFIQEEDFLKNYFPILIGTMSNDTLEGENTIIEAVEDMKSRISHDEINELENKHP